MAQNRHRTPRKTPSPQRPVSPAEGADQVSLHLLPDSEACWTRETLVAATGGEWINPPPRCWSANGIAISPGRVRPGTMLCYDSKWLPPQTLRLLSQTASGIIAENSQELKGFGLPVLEVANMELATINLARYAREHYEGKVIALTGSVGKTGTSYLLSKVLSVFGPVEHTRASGNSPRANACLLASISGDIPFWVTEVALNNPSLISSFVRPHVAIVLAISQAHLIYWKDTKTVAKRKSAIFSGMEAGGFAVLNRDMLEYEIIAEEAQKRELGILAYGTSPEAQIRLLNSENGIVSIRMPDAEYSFPCTLPPHMQRNMLGILGAVYALGRPVERCFEALRDPELLPGRGRRHTVFFDDKQISLIDDSYNANPHSMRATLQDLHCASPRPEARVAVLGDIAELGVAEQELHLELVDPIRKAGLNRLLLCGPLMRAVWEQVKGEVNGKWFEGPKELQAEIGQWLASGDVVIVKSSGHKLGDIVEDLLNRNRVPARDVSADAGGPVVAFGGNVNIGRGQHLVSKEHGPAYALGSVPLLREADLALASLSCVAAAAGQSKLDKGFVSASHLRARPEQLAVLRESGIRLVATANNHSGDYGDDARREQWGHLDAMGIAHAGSGAHVSAARRPAYVRVQNYVLALFSIDTTLPFFAAGPQTAGNWHLPVYNPDMWYKECMPLIAQARKTAHIVLFALHANVDGNTGPGRSLVYVSRALINAGADAVLGTSPQTRPTLEVYKERPIIYGTGDLLDDRLQGGPRDLGLFALSLSPLGIASVRFFPLLSTGGRTEAAQGNDAARGIAAFTQRSKGLAFETQTQGQYAEVKLHPQRPVTLPLSSKKKAPPPVGEAPAPLLKPRSEWVLHPTSTIPNQQAISPVSIGPLTLLGYWIPSSSLVLRMPRTIWVESYWSIKDKLDEDLQLEVTVGPDEPAAFRFGAGTQHDPCDWMWPTGRWEPGVVYRDIAELPQPALLRTHSAELTLRFRVLRRNEELGCYLAPTRILLKLPGQG